MKKTSLPGLCLSKETAVSTFIVTNQSCILYMSLLCFVLHPALVMNHGQNDLPLNKVCPLFSDFLSQRRSWPGKVWTR